MVMICSSFLGILLTVYRMQIPNNLMKTNFFNLFHPVRDILSDSQFKLNSIYFSRLAALSKFLSFYKPLTISYEFSILRKNFMVNSLYSDPFKSFSRRSFSMSHLSRQSSNPKIPNSNTSSNSTMKPNFKGRFFDSHSIFLAIKKANSVSLLPKKIEILYQNIFVRIFRFIGGICLLIVLTSYYLKIPVYLHNPIIIIGFLQSVQIFIIFIIKICYGFYTLKYKKKEFEVRNSPLNKYATQLA